MIKRTVKGAINQGAMNRAPTVRVAFSYLIFMLECAAE